MYQLPEIPIPAWLCGCSFIEKEKKKNTPSRIENSHLPVLRPHLSVIPWFLVLKG